MTKAVSTEQSSELKKEAYEFLSIHRGIGMFNANVISNITSDMPSPIEEGLIPKITGLVSEFIIKEKEFVEYPLAFEQLESVENAASVDNMDELERALRDAKSFFTLNHKEIFEIRNLTTESGLLDKAVQYVESRLRPAEL